MSPAIGVRHLAVLGEFKPFGLVAESLDGHPPEPPPEKYDYFLFDPDLVRDRDDLDFSSPSPAPFPHTDHELFIRGNRIIWSTGQRVHKRFSSPNPILMVCWCRMDAITDPLLCALQVDTLSIYSTNGEVVSLPLPYSVVSIWSLPFGVLLQKLMDGSRPVSSSSSLLNAREFPRHSKEHGLSHYSPSHLSAKEPFIKDDAAANSSHLILQHPMEEPQGTYYKERGKLNPMKDYDERTIWTSDMVPLMASYHKVRSQHSIWLVESACNTTGFNSNVNTVSSNCFSRQFSFSKIWQGKHSNSAASKVFLATDFDGVPIVCFLLHEQKLLLAVRLVMHEDKDGDFTDIKADRSWTITAIAAAPVMVTRPRFKVGLLPFSDMVVLASENALLLYSGEQCLRKYLFPVDFGKTSFSHSEQSSITKDSSDSKIRGIADAVEGRVNVIVNDGQIFRCALRKLPCSSLANDCVIAMAEGLSSSLYKEFTSLLWGTTDFCDVTDSNSHIDSEWESFSSVIRSICGKYAPTAPIRTSSLSNTAWKSLLKSKFHAKYSRHNTFTGISFTNGQNFGGLVETGVCAEAEETNEQSSYAQFLTEALDSLHCLYESLKLDVLRKRDAWLLVVLLCNLATALGEAAFVDYYVRDFPDIICHIGTFHSNSAPRVPPSLSRWLEQCLRQGFQVANIQDVPPLLFKGRGNAVSWARKVAAFYSLILGAESIGRRLSSGLNCDISKGTASTPEERTVLAMVAERFGRQQLDLLPIGVSLPICHALDKCRETPPSDWPPAAYALVGREDLAMTCLGESSIINNSASDSCVNLISISVPYMLHLQPVTVPSSVHDIAGYEQMKSEEGDSGCRSKEDGMEHIFNSSMQLRYGRDLRMMEVRRLLCSTRHVAIQVPVNPSASDQDLQQHQLWNLAQRTTALPFGRGAFTLSTTYTLLTEVLPVPKLVLAGRLPSQQNAIVNLDPGVRSISELVSWPEFHNGVATGLKLAPFQAKISRSWIHYNSPEEPNPAHAGTLFGLGLHEHLRVLTVADTYRFLNLENEITTVGLLLGMAASYRGTMHPIVTKMLYIHVPPSHQASYPELELPTLLQTAALMGLGLLYEGSAHPLTMKTLLSEIGSRSGGDNVLEREGYAVAAGSALGLVALGRGQDAFGFMENLVERLFQYIGGKSPFNERFLSAVHRTDDSNRGPVQMMDSVQVNIDVTAPGATIALALIFMKTESEVIASKISIPTTHFDLQYVRPDFIMLRIIARNIILWSRVRPSKDWIDSQIAEIVSVGISRFGDGSLDDDEMDTEALIQAFINIVTGCCISLALKYAGTRNSDAQGLLYYYTMYFLNEIKHISSVNTNTLPKGLLQYVDRGTLEVCLHMIALSLSVVMAGSGHLQTFRLLRYLHNRSSAEGHINYGMQMAVSLAIGFLFLGGGMRTFSTGNSAVAALLITLYPRLPSGPHDNRCHLQAFRHLYVIAAESRWLQTVDVDTGLPVYAPLEVKIKETEHYAETGFCEVTPCILPERSVLKSVRVCRPRYWPQVIQLVPEDGPWWRYGDKNNPFNGGVLYVKRRVGCCSYVDDPTGCQSLFSRAMHKVLDASGDDEHAMNKVDQLVSTFSADPSLIAFAQVCSESYWSRRSDASFQDFCSQVLFECVSKDMPALLQAYLSLYTTVASIGEQVKNSHVVYCDSLFLSSFKVALAYNEALISGKLDNTRGGIIQSTFLESLGKRIEEILAYSGRLQHVVQKYLDSGKWLYEQQDGSKLDYMLLSWYLQWYNVPPAHILESAMEKIKSVAPFSKSVVPMLRLLFPMTNAKVLSVFDKPQGSSSP